MRHLDDIAILVRTLRSTEVFHALVIQSPPGWAKSTTVERILSEGRIPFRAFGAYSTPLALYNALGQWPNDLHVIDDCAGLFTSPISMAVLKAATWASAGSGGERRVAWSSTSEKVSREEFFFKGKLILLTNVLPAGPETAAFLSRTLHLQLDFTTSEVRTLLLEAAADLRHFADQKRSGSVAEFLANMADTTRPGLINLRALQLGYDLAGHSAGDWQSILKKLLPQRASPRELVQQLQKEGGSLQSQLRMFQSGTGLSERTFYNYRNELGISKRAGVRLRKQKLQFAVMDGHGKGSESQDGVPPS